MGEMDGQRQDAMAHCKGMSSDLSMNTLVLKSKGRANFRVPANLISLHA
jgi:hypothetical protein